MKNLLKAEFFILRKNKVKILLIPILVFTYLIGVIYAFNLQTEYLSQVKLDYIDVFKVVGSQSDIDYCATAKPDEMPSKSECGSNYFTEEQIDFAKKRIPYNKEFSQNANRMYTNLIENDKENYYKHRRNMLIAAKEMEAAGFSNGYYSFNDLTYPDDNIIIDTEVAMIEDILENDMAIQLTPFDINANNYLRFFLSSGGTAAFVMIILLFNQSYLVSEDSHAVNNVIYSQTYPRDKINATKIIVSATYSLLSLVISLTIGYFIVASLFGFGSLKFPTLISDNINSFANLNMHTYKAMSIGSQLKYISLMTVLILLASLMLMHLITMLSQNSGPGLFLLYFFLGFRFIFKSFLGKFIKYLPFAYDNMNAVFLENYSFVYGLSSLLIITVLSFLFTLYSGNRIDLKGGD